MKFAFFTLTLAPLNDENMNSELCFNQNKKKAGLFGIVHENHGRKCSSRHFSTV